MTLASTRRRAASALLLLAPIPSLGALAGLGLLPVGGHALWFVGKIWLFGLPLVWHRYVDGEPWSLSPLRRGGLGVGALSGLVIGAGIAVLAWALADALPRTELRTQLAAAGLLEPERYLALATYLIVINSVLEEYVFRWFIFRKWEVLVGGHAAVMLAAAVFTVHHVILMGAYFSAWVAALAGTGVFAGGVLWSFLYLRYRSLWPGYVSHALVDVAILTVGWALL